jgi:hypothetical protein
VSALEAKLKAEGEYEVYRKHQDAEYVSDFDRVVQEAKRLEGGREQERLGPVSDSPHRATTSRTMSSTRSTKKRTR